MLPVLRQYVGSPARLVSPFLGGGAVEVDASCRGVPVLAGDNYADLIDFWQQVLTNSQAVGLEAKKLWPGTLAEASRDKLLRSKGHIWSDTGQAS